MYFVSQHVAIRTANINVVLYQIYQFHLQNVALKIMKPLFSNTCYHRSNNVENYRDESRENLSHLIISNMMPYLAVKWLKMLS